MYTYEDQLDSRYPNLVQNSFGYDADANRISESKGEENRRTVDEDELGEYLPQAVVAAEDKRFYEHYGADPTSIGRSMRRSSLVYPQIGWFKAAGTEVLRRVVQSGTASFYHDLDSEVGRPPPVRPALLTTSWTHGQAAKLPGSRPPSGSATQRDTGP